MERGGFSQYYSDIYTGKIIYMNEKMNGNVPAKKEDIEKEVKETKQVMKEHKIAELVTSSKTLDFPELGWGIHAGDAKEMPESKEAQEIILGNPFISKLK